MNFKLSAFIFSSVVMQTHGENINWNCGFYFQEDYCDSNFVNCLDQRNGECYNEECYKYWFCPTGVNPGVVVGGQTFFEGWGRRLDNSDITEINDCKEVMYQISVKTTGISEAHIQLLAKPKINEGEEESSECPILTFDSATINGKLYNTIKILKGVSDDKESLFLGLFQLNAILDAFTTADTQNSGTKYDFFANNCASFLISVGLELGIIPGEKEKIISFIAHQISSKFVMDKLSATGDEKIHTNEFDGDNEDVVVEEFISNYIHQHI